MSSPCRLLQRDEHQIGERRFVPVDAGLQGQWFGNGRSCEGGEDLLSGVVGMNLERHRMQEPERLVKVDDLLLEKREELEQPRRRPS